MPEVLVVDDSISVRKALELTLRPQGLKVRSAASGEEALTAMRESLAELVIVDVVMPGLSGFDVCRELRAQPASAGVPVLLISGIVDAEVHRQAGEVGATGVLKKPFTPDELLPMVRAALEKAGTPADAPPTDYVRPSREPTVLPDDRPALNGPPLVTDHPAGPAAAPPRPARLDHVALLGQLAQKPGVLGAAAYDLGGAPRGAAGQALPEQVGHYARFYLATAAVLGTHAAAGPLATVQLEYEGRSLLLAKEGDTLIVCLLKDASSASVVKYLLRAQHRHMA